MQQGYKGVRDENGIMRAVRDYPTGAPPTLVRSELPQLFIVTNSNMWEDDRFIIGMTHKNEVGLVADYGHLGDVSVVLLVCVEIKLWDLTTRLRPYRVPAVLRNGGLTDHVVLPLRNLSQILEVNIPGFPNVGPVTELRGEDAIEALRMFLRLYKGSRMRNRIYAQLHRHLRLLDTFMSYATYDQCMRELGYLLNERGLYEVPPFVPTQRINFAPKPEVRPYIKGSAIDQRLAQIDFSEANQGVNP